MVKETEYYDILGVQPNADEAQIRKGYKKGALKWHPDKHSQSPPEVQEEAAEKFKNIAKAYEVLSNPETRKIYDQMGEEGLERSGRAPDMDELFRHMAGMGFPFAQRRQRPKEPQMPNLTCEIELTLPQIWAGTVVDFKVKRYVLKEGANPTIQDLVCQACRGQGQQIRMEQVGPGMMRQYQMPCDQCRGEGMRLSEEYFEQVEKTLRKTIPRGVIHKHQIVTPGAGHEIPPAMRKGSVGKTDVVIVIKESQTYQVPGTNFTYIRGEAGSPFNLQISLELEPELAICGGYKELVFIDGSKFLVEIPPGLVFQETPSVIVPNKGMPVYGVMDTNSQNKYGDLFVKFDITSEGLTDETYSKIYQAMTGRSKEDDEKAQRDAHGGVTELGIAIEEYAESERLDQVKDDFRQFNQEFNAERRSTMERRMREGQSTQNEGPEAQANFGGDPRFQAQFEGDAPPGCPVQ